MGSNKVNRQAYLAEIKRSKWYGPFKHSRWKFFYIYSAMEDGLNLYYVEIGINVSANPFSSSLINGITVKIHEGKDNVKEFPIF